MNVIKIKDILMPNVNSDSEFFNSKLKGKYAYWIKMRYIFSLESLSYSKYIKYEQLSDEEFPLVVKEDYIDMYSEEYCMLDFVSIFIDEFETERINNITDLLAANRHITNSELDINLIKKFRTWLAKELLYLNGGFITENLGRYTEDQLHMLLYYKGNMYNDVIKQLSIFGKSTASVSVINSISSCSCGSNNELFDITETCDCVNIYRKNVHNLMVKTFEDVDFWLTFNKEFIKIFKNYIDNIINVGLIIDNGKSIAKSTCFCNSYDNSSNEKMLKDLSKALEYIYCNDIISHKNFIHDALYNWAEYLYDYMYWN